MAGAGLNAPAVDPQQPSSTGETRSPARLIGPPLHLRVRFATIALALAAYVGLEWLSFIHELRGLPVTPWNPGIGVLFAVVLLWGRRYGLLIFAGVLLAELLVLRTHLPWPMVAAVAGTIACIYTIAAEAMRSALRLDIRIDRLRDLVVLLLCSALAALAVAILLALLFSFDTRMDPAELRAAARQLFVGDIIGIAVMTPLTLRLAHLRIRTMAGGHRRSFQYEAGALLLGIFAALWIVERSVTDADLHYFYVLFLPVVAAAARFGFDGACLALAVVQFSLVAMLHMLGADIRAFTEIQTLMFVLTATGLVVGAEVSERRRAEAQLRELRSEEAQAARFSLVTGMASSLAHEINQPMTAARALMRSAQLLMQASDPDLARANSNLGTAIAQIDHAGGVLRRMRDFLRRGRPQIGMIAVRGLIEETLLLSRAEAVARRVHLDAELPAESLQVAGDKVQLQQVLLNLVRNAIEAVAAGGFSDRQVHISAVQAGRLVEFRIADNGPGVPPELRETLFEPLRTSKREGLGLGLAISAMIVESHGGRIWLHCGGPRQVEFRFSVPLQIREPG